MQRLGVDGERGGRSPRPPATPTRHAPGSPVTRHACPPRPPVTLTRHAQPRRPRPPASEADAPNTCASPTAHAPRQATSDVTRDPRGAEPAAPEPAEIINAHAPRCATRAARAEQPELSEPPFGVWRAGIAAEPCSQPARLHPRMKSRPGTRSMAPERREATGPTNGLLPG